MTLVRTSYGCRSGMLEDNASVASSVASIVRGAVPEKWKRGLREHILRLRINHIFGPRYVALAKNEAAVTCVVKNGEFYLDSFVEHYSKMGFRHIFFLDNGSIDNTISLARKHTNVTMYECGLPIDAYQRLFKKRLAEMAIPVGWCLDVDIDEYFDFPFSNL